MVDKLKSIKNIFEESEFVKEPILPDNKIQGIIEFAKGIVLLASPLLYLYKVFKGTSKKKFRTVKEIQKHINDNKFIDTIISFGSALVTAILGIKLIFFFVPDNSQISLALLIQYLKFEGVIGKSFYKILKKFKPENIGGYVDPTKFKNMLKNERENDKLSSIISDETTSTEIKTDDGSGDS